MNEYQIAVARDGVASTAPTCAAPRPSNSLSLKCARRTWTETMSYEDLLRKFVSADDSSVEVKAWSEANGMNPWFVATSLFRDGMALLRGEFIID